MSILKTDQNVLIDDLSIKNVWIYFNINLDRLFNINFIYIMEHKK